MNQTTMKLVPNFAVVVHIKDPAQALEQTRVALTNGADGVFLIDHRASKKNLLQAFELVRSTFSEAWIGLNFLGLSPQAAFDATPATADGLWLDHVAPEERPSTRRPHEHCAVFAGAAFKYQEQQADLAKETLIVSGMCDVVTTSGPATGVPPHVSKLQTMRVTLGNGLLGLASGVTAENVQPFLEFVNCFLVATGVSKDFHTLDPDKVRALSSIIRAAKGPSEEKSEPDPVLEELAKAVQGTAPPEARDWPCVAILSGPAQMIELMVRIARRATGARIDWGYMGGRAIIRSAGDRQQIRQALHRCFVESDIRYEEFLQPHNVKADGQAS